MFLVAALAWAVAALKLRRPEWLLLGVMLANAWAWGMTNYPLQRPYGLDVGGDRVKNVAMCQVVATGHTPLRTPQIGQLSVEPFWSGLVGTLALGSPERLLAIYPFLSLATALGFALSLYLGLAAGGSAWSGWERAMVAGFATLLSSTPLDFTTPQRVPWMLMFLLKPNHALGLLLLPLVLAAFHRIRGWRGRIGVALLLQLLAWVFVLHMFYVAVGFGLLALHGWWRGGAEGRRDATDAAVVVGLNLLVASPYLAMLLFGFPFLRASPDYAIADPLLHLLAPVVASGPLLALALLGAGVAWRRGDRLGRSWVAMLAGAALVWVGYLGLGALGLAREPDEIYNWCRFLIAANAGIGSWALVQAGWRLVTRRPFTPQLAAAVLVALAAPAALPAWWEPLRMDAYFRGSLAPLDRLSSEPARFVLARTDRDTVLAGDLYLNRTLAALTGRRAVMIARMGRPGDWSEREQAQRDLVQSDDPAVALAAARRFGAGFLVVTPRFLEEHRRTPLAALEARPHLERVHFTSAAGGDYVAIYRIRSGEEP